MKFIIIGLTMTLSQGVIASKENIDAGRLTLKKWGLAYCLNKHKNNSDSGIDVESSLNGYFQTGIHTEEDAYKNVREYFDIEIKKTIVTGQETGKKIILMACLDAYESNNYKKIITRQDKFIK